MIANTLIASNELPIGANKYPDLETAIAHSINYFGRYSSRVNKTVIVSKTNKSISGFVIVDGYVVLDDTTTDNYTVVATKHPDGYWMVTPLAIDILSKVIAV